MLRYTSTPISKFVPGTKKALAELLAKGCDEAGTVCHGLPRECARSASRPCEVLAKVTTLGDLVHVELNALAGQSNLHLDLKNRWIALGFSNFQSDIMPDSAVVHCLNYGNGTVTAKLTYNIPIRHLNIGWANVDQAPLEVISAVADDDSLGCVVNLRKNFSIDKSEFDLTQKHNLIAASGPFIDEKIKNHDRIPDISLVQHAF
ncbi:hypothetical protein BV898_18600 [Hypsibius exemplaris]|uniref:Uncharacterized protein n=1 Tax=Hypsibius exemplaris TaxID=2072580 RepID=A0A9X6RP04_HYPEX|nr:hypothetical protein BV898_18600 [Hypsibius exemplaris]